MHPLDRCIKHPPLAGSDGPTTAELKMVGAVRIGDNQQCPAGYCSNLSYFASEMCCRRTQNLLAKIYDHSLLRSLNKQDDADPFLCVDRDYASETAVYLTLPQLYGTVIPKLLRLIRASMAN
ncbi:hypothetical protein PABG_05216 [Paracoccidioides brasiliensis Pb03]|nr:hypothetical protein PABG_05216 [Paracoccidioides brasiliensis Pb03]